jgi:hypothetical protein
MLAALGSRAYGAGDPPMKEALTLLRSANNESRTQGRMLVLTDRALVVESLIEMIKAPYDKQTDGWLIYSTSRNIAIECIGAYRAAEAVPALIPLLEPAAGESVTTNDRTFRLCPAGETLAKIGRPSVSALVALLAATADIKKMSASQARLVLSDIEGVAGVEKVLKDAINAEKEPVKSANLKSNLTLWQEAMKK